MAKEPRRTVKDKRKFEEITADPTTIDTICSHVSNGGTLITLAETWDVPFGYVSNWLHADKERNSRYIQALNDRAEWGKERVLQELRYIGLSDIRQAYDANGKLKPPHEWPESVARAIAGVETLETFEGSGNARTYIGETQKLKFIDKTKGLELLGKNMALFIERHEHQHKVSLEDLVSASNDKPEGEKDA